MNELVRLYQEGYTVRELSIRFDLTHDEVLRQLAAAGVRGAK